MIRCGVDIVRIARLEEIPASVRARFIQRVFSPAEQEHARDRNESLAGLFAAKEATAKALGTGLQDISWQEVEILPDDLGRPCLHLKERALQRAQELGLEDWSLSISHDGGIAVAMVVAQGSQKG